MTHSSSFALEALRRRVRKSLIGSVMLDVFLSGRAGHIRPPWAKVNLPGGFDDAGDLAGEGEFAERQAGNAELALVAARAAAERAPVADARRRGIARELLQLLLR